MRTDVWTANDKVQGVYKPVIHFRSHHESGNIFALLSLIRNALIKQRRVNDFNALRDRVFETTSYDEALTVMREVVTLIDDDGKY